MGIADYMGASLDVNDKHIMHMYIKYKNNIRTYAMTNLQAYKHNGY